MEVEEEGEEVEQGWSCHCCLLETAGPTGGVEGGGPGEQQRSESERKMEEEEGEAGDGGEEEEVAAGGLLYWEEVEGAGHREFLVWRVEVEEELRQGPWMEEVGEGLHGHLWMGEEEGVVVLRCGAVAEEEEGLLPEKEAVGVLQAWR